MPVRIKLTNGSTADSIGKTNAYIGLRKNLVLKITFQVLECKTDCILRIPFFVGYNP